MMVYIVEGSNWGESWTEKCFSTLEMADKCLLYLETNNNNRKHWYHIYEIEVEESFEE